MGGAVSKLADVIFFRKHGICPRWFCFTFDNRLRRLVQNPDRIIRPFVGAGETVLDVGPGIGYFTIPMARRAGSGGRVIAADIQESMLRGIARRAERAGVSGQIELYLSRSDEIYSGEPVDFILAFWMAHEVPRLDRFFRQLQAALKPAARFLLAEPKLHVSRTQFDGEIAAAQNAGLALLDRPSIPLSHSALFGCGQPVGAGQRVSPDQRK
jgi:2-polyprenyl-3-methyl-5-hydroxy-6-metoxy-1,4-benzoquinol methylase